MNDISLLDNRLTNVEYYVSLNMLEQKAKDQYIPAIADGVTNRFKNGIFVDSFDDLSRLNATDPEFFAAVDPINSELIAQFDQSKFDLSVVSSTNIQQTGQVLTVPYTTTALVTQPYASVHRTVTNDYWLFVGKLTLTPNYDNFYETRTSPQPLSVSGTATTVATTTNLNNVIALNQPANTATSNSNIDGTFVTSTTAGSSTATIPSPGPTTPVGDFVTSANFSPYIREQVLRFTATGLRPSTRVWISFDGVDVSSVCQPATYSSSSTTYVNGTNVTGIWAPYGLIGQSLITDITGTVSGLFYLPNASFFVGDRVMVISDVSNIRLLSSATTTASATFSAYNFSTTSGTAVSTQTYIYESYTQPTMNTASVAVYVPPVIVPPPAACTVNFVTPPPPPVEQTPVVVQNPTGQFTIMISVGEVNTGVGGLSATNITYVPSSNVYSIQGPGIINDDAGFLRES